MKKSFVKIKDSAAFPTFIKKVKNMFSGEKGAEIAQLLIDLIEEVGNTEVEVDDDVFIERIMEILTGKGELPAPIADAIANGVAKRFAALQNTMPVANALTPKIKNEIAASILRQKNADEKSVRNAVDEVLVRNSITGLAFADVIDFAIVTKWQDLNPLFAQLHQSFYNKFFYSEQEMTTAAILAKQWDKVNASNVEKTIQQLTVNGKTISTKYIYKRQQAAFEDLDEIEQAGEMSNFLTWINTEIDMMIVNTIVMAILVGDGINAAGERVTTFESLGTKTTSDAFTKVTSLAAGTTVTLSHLRSLADAVLNPLGKKKVLVISQSLLTAVSQFVYANGGSVSYRTKEEIAGHIGVDEIFVTDILGAYTGADANIAAEVIIPDGYWYKEKKYLSVAYPFYEKNVQNFQKERNIGGAVHDLFSTAVLKVAK